MKRAILIILDGVGIGELPDAANYGDQGSNTLANLAEATGGLNLPNMAGLGLGCIHKIKGVDCLQDSFGCFGKMAEMSPGKDSTTGHWELAGLVLDKPFPTYPQGFPQKIIKAFTDTTGYDILGNYPASGTEILKELGEEHLRTGKPIIYTSADSVFQIAAHEKIIPLAKLYNICQAARELLTGEHAVARVIARPFTGDNKNNFVRTKYRKDFSLKPHGKIILKILQEAHIPTIAIGKINDLYAYQGIDHNIFTKSNREGMKALNQALIQYPNGLIMANLVDFDMLWGHRNDIGGFKNGLEDFDKWLKQYKRNLAAEDILFITSDHGNDPTTPSTDHSREYVPILVYGNAIKSGMNLGTRSTFADLQATLCEYYSVSKGPFGTSFLDMIAN